jgi:hypothetical protein
VNKRTKKETKSTLCHLYVLSTIVFRRSINTIFVSDFNFGIGPNARVHIPIRRGKVIFYVMKTLKSVAYLHLEACLAWHYFLDENLAFCSER